MTHPTHGLDPNELEAAVLPCDIHLPPATTLCKGVSLAALLTGLKARGMVLPDLAALSQNPGTSGDEPYVPTIIRNESAGFYEFVTEDVPALYSGIMAANVERIGTLKGDLIGFRIYDPLEPRASDRGAVTDEMVRAGAFAAWASTTPFAGLTEAAFRAKSDQHVRSADLGGGTTLEQDMLLDWELNTDTFCVLARATLEAAIRKLSEVSHEH